MHEQDVCRSRGLAHRTGQRHTRHTQPQTSQQHLCGRGISGQRAVWGRPALEDGLTCGLLAGVLLPLCAAFLLLFPFLTMVSASAASAAYPAWVLGPQPAHVVACSQGRMSELYMSVRPAIACVRLCERAAEPTPGGREGCVHRLCCGSCGAKGGREEDLGLGPCCRPAPRTVTATPSSLLTMALVTQAGHHHREASSRPSFTQAASSPLPHSQIHQTLTMLPLALSPLEASAAAGGYSPAASLDVGSSSSSVRALLGVIESPGKTTALWILLSVLLVVVSGLCAGLTLGLMSQDLLELEVGERLTLVGCWRRQWSLARVRRNAAAGWPRHAQFDAGRPQCGQLAPGPRCSRVPSCRRWTPHCRNSYL